MSETAATCRRLAGEGFRGHLAMSWLNRRGLLKTSGQRVQLSDKGHHYAQRLVRSHRLWESWLDQNFDLATDHLHDPAEAMEHFIGPGM